MGHHRDALESLDVADETWNESSFSVAWAAATSNVQASGTAKSASGHLCSDLPPAIIAEIFRHLDARALSMMSCVCRLFHKLSSDSHGWKDLYCERWGDPAACTSKDIVPAMLEDNWKKLYVAREVRSKAFIGRYRTDMMTGHTKTIRCVRLLSAANLVFTAGYDTIIRIWDLEECLPVTWSRPLGDTVRAIAVDMAMLVVGGTDAKLKVWRAVPGLAHIFDVAAGMPHTSKSTLYGHDGPITSVDIDKTKICSGSWDMTIRIWDRGTLECVSILVHRDWVWSLSLRGQRVVSAAGGDVYSWDAETGESLKVRVGAHVGQVYAVECNRSGHFVFSGGEDGFVRMYEEKSLQKQRTSCKHLITAAEPYASWRPHSGPVHALSFDDPWLVSASGDGMLAMMDIRKNLKNSDENTISATTTKFKGGWAPVTIASTDSLPPQRMLFGSGQGLYSVDIGADRIVSAGEKIVKVWDFSLAFEIERRVQASKASRLKQQMKRKQIAQQHKSNQENTVCVVTSSCELREGGPTWQRNRIKLKA